MYPLPLDIQNPYLPELCRIAERAGDIILGFYKKDTAVETKGDGSPVTEADRAADAYISAELRRLFPGIPVISEEGTQEDVSAAPLFWLVDPLDGSKSFIRNGKNWTVNIALIDAGRSVLGVVHVPVQDVMYGGEVGAGAFRIRRNGPRERIRARAIPAQGATVITSHHHKSGEAESSLNGVKVYEYISSASSIKFCKIAEGSADLYPRSGPTMEWDTAAGQAVVEAAGGCMTDDSGAPFRYGKAGFRNGGFRVCGQLYRPCRHE